MHSNVFIKYAYKQMPTLRIQCTLKMWWYQLGTFKKDLKNTRAEKIIYIYKSVVLEKIAK